jgi:hypothetical protein
MAKPKSAVHAVAPNRAIPLELAPLLKPYRKHGKLSLRVERVQQLARLSRGRNNGDGSWSLATDELDDLEYLSPEGSDHTLSIRIIGVDQDLATLAVIDFPISHSSKKAKRSQDNFPDGEAQRQFEESEQLKTALAERVAELAELQGMLQQVETDKARQIASAVEIARASWKEEVDQQLAAAAARTASDLAQSQNWQGEKNALLSEAKEREEKRVAEARERAKREAEAAKSESEKAWKAGEAARFAKAEAEWQEGATKTLADLQARYERSEAALTDLRTRAEAAAKSAPDAQEHRRLLEEVASVRASLATRESEIVRIRHAAEEAAKSAPDAHEHRRLLEEVATSRAALATRESEIVRMRLAAEEAEARRKADEAKAQADAAAAQAARFAKAEAEWRESAAKSLAEVKARTDRAEVELAQERARAAGKAELEIEHRRLAEELKMVRGTLTDRESELARTRAAVQDGVGTKADQEEHRRLSEEISNLRLVLVDREADLARARAAAQEGASKADQGEARRLAEELAAARAALTARETELSRARTTAEKTQEQLQQAAETAIEQAKKDFKAAEAAQLNAAEAKWRKQSEAAVAAATAKLEETERALARAKVEAEQGIGDAIVQGLHDELTGLRAALADRESELAQIRAKEVRVVTPQKILLKEHHGWGEEQQAPPPRRTKVVLLVIQVIVVTLFVVGAIVYGPNAEEYIPESVWNLFGYTRLPESPPPPAPASTPAAAPEQAVQQADALPTATLLRDAKVHDSPAMSGAVVTTVEHGAKVVVLGQHGKWTHIRIDDAKSQEGWVYNTFLSGDDQSTEAARQKKAP